MKWGAILVWLCGCNRIFGTGTSTHIDPDARFFDGMPDAPFACPAIGSANAPAFVNQFQQIDTLQSCSLYSPSTRGTAVGFCGGLFSQGPVEGPLAVANLNSPSIPIVKGLRFSPEADLLVVEGSSYGLITETVITPDQADLAIILNEPAVEVFAFDPTQQMWSSVTDLGAVVTTAPTPLMNGVRHLITIDGSGILTELTGDGASWTAGPPFDLATIGVMGAGAVIDYSNSNDGPNTTPNPDPTLTTDGLRLVVPGITAMGQPVLYYTDRSDINATFGMARTLDVPGDIKDPYMTDDCSRLYFSALDTVFYMSQ